MSNSQQLIVRSDLGSYGSYGQNIAMYAATNNLGSEVEFIRTSITEYWYNGEIDLYGNSYGSEPSMDNFHGWGHFSQIVWKSTKEVGCAVAYCESGLSSYPGYYSVCNYGPPGKQMPDNVLSTLQYTNICIQVTSVASMAKTSAPPTVRPRLAYKVSLSRGNDGGRSKHIFWRGIHLRYPVPGKWSWIDPPLGRQFLSFDVVL